MRSNWVRFPAIVLGIVVVLALMLWMNRECSAQTGQQAIQNMNALGCADYWFGRYQTLIGFLLIVPALLTLRTLLSRHLVYAARDRALTMQEIWIRRSRELVSATALAGEAVRIGSEIGKGAPAIAETVTTEHIDAHVDAANGWLMRLSVLEGKADEAFAGFVGGPEISAAMRRLAETIAELRRRMGGELKALSISTPPRRYAGSDVVEGREIFIQTAQSFAATGREITQAGETLRAQIEQERTRLQQILHALDRRVFG